MGTIQAVYIMGFTPEKLDSNTLVQMVQAADRMLQGQNPAFKQLMQKADKDKAKINISNQQFIPTMHNPQTMQATLGGWLSNDKLPFKPVMNENFFVKGMRDPQGRENYVLFYLHQGGK